MADENVFSCCFTGYRPQKLPFPIDPRNKEYIAFENKLMHEILELANNGCRTFISGMAMGFDIIAAECVLLISKVPKFCDEDIKLVCALPFIGQANNYPAEWRARYARVIKAAAQSITVSNDYYRGCYYDRNRFMVDNSDCVVTWFDGSPGGTKNTIDYAKKIGRKVININTEYSYD